MWHVPHVRKTSEGQCDMCPMSETRQSDNWHVPHVRNTSERQLTCTPCQEHVRVTMWHVPHVRNTSEWQCDMYPMLGTRQSDNVTCIPCQEHVRVKMWHVPHVRTRQSDNVTCIPCHEHVKVTMWHVSHVRNTSEWQCDMYLVPKSHHSLWQYDRKVIYQNGTSTSQGQREPNIQNANQNVKQRIERWIGQTKNVKRTTKMWPL